MRPPLFSGGNAACWHGRRGSHLGFNEASALQRRKLDIGMSLPRSSQRFNEASALQRRKRAV